MRWAVATARVIPILSVLAACGTALPPRAPADKTIHTTSAALATFEVRDDEIDRFEHCPPAGEIGQDWIPLVPEWHPSSASASASPPGSSAGNVDAVGATSAQASDAEPPQAPVSVAALTSAALNATHESFRRCYHKGLIYDPTQDGHVGVVLHVDKAGHVAGVETWGACDLTPEAIVCMRDEAAHLELPPPIDGSATVTVPAVFTTATARTSGSNDAYAAGVYVAVESMRPRLHACLDEAHRSGTGVTGSALLTIDVDAKGHASHVAVDQWKGAQSLLGCAAQALQAAAFPEPAAGRGRVVVPLVFNPRPGTR